MTDESPVRWERRGMVVIATLNRPEAKNAVSPEMLALLTERFAEFQADDSLRVAVLTGAGETFCAGGDLKALLPDVVAAGGLAKVVPDPAERIFSKVYKPIVCAVNGGCIAGGIELLLGTDIRLATPDAFFATPEVNWGLIGAGGICTRLPRQIPTAIAMEMMLTGRRVGAIRAAEVGLINGVVPSSALLAEALALAESIARSAPLAVQATKEAAVRGAALESAYTIEAVLSENVFASEDAKEGLLAFGERRHPSFRGV